MGLRHGFRNVQISRRHRLHGGVRLWWSRRSHCCPSLVTRLYMKFVLVNGRIPSPPSFCGLCCRPISESYLREIATRLSYCDQRCYAGHCKVAARAIEYGGRASRGGFTDVSGLTV